MHEYWCELEVVRLHIFSEFLLKDGMLKYEKKVEKDSTDVVKLYLYHYTNRKSVSYNSHTYREIAMSQKGFYIGHHFGDKAYMRIENNEIHLCSNNYNRIIWSYVVKYVLTIKCLEHGWIHLKAAAVDYNNGIYIIFGRGGSGKTELIKKLSGFGGKIVSNTHLIIREKDIIGIESNVRVRDKNGQDFYLSPSKCFDNCEFGKNIHPIKALIWCNHRNDKNGMITEIKADYMLSLVRKFGNALDAWELKEDVFDYYSSDPVLISQKLIQNDTLLENFIKNQNNYYFNLNVFEREDSNKILKFLN